MPLALELAAARTKALTPEQILERLGQRLDLFQGGRDAEERQKTLRATIEWSHDLLSPEEQQLFARLGVFVGGCDARSGARRSPTPTSTRSSRSSRRAFSAIRTTGSGCSRRSASTRVERLGR